MKKTLWAALSALLLALAGLALWHAGPAVDAQGGSVVRITAPSDGASANNPVTVQVQPSGATIKAATDNDPNAAHLHYFIDRDPATVLRPGEPIPTGQPDIVHTADMSLQLPTLAPGQHRVWVVLAHTDHTPYSPNVQAQVSFTVGGAAQGAPTQLPATGDAAGVSRILLGAVIAASALFLAGLALGRKGVRR